MHTLPLTIIFQSLGEDAAESSDSWISQFMIGEPVGIQWLYLLIGAIVIAVLCRLVYTSMLHGQVAANRHPANFRKMIYALGLLAVTACFVIVFSDVFGGIMMIFLAIVWVICALIFVFTRRKVSAAQA